MINKILLGKNKIWNFIYVRKMQNDPNMTKEYPKLSKIRFLGDFSKKYFISSCGKRQ